MHFLATFFLMHFPLFFCFLHFFAFHLSLQGVVVSPLGSRHSQSVQKRSQLLALLAQQAPPSQLQAALLFPSSQYLSSAKCGRLHGGGVVGATGPVP